MVRFVLSVMVGGWWSLAIIYCVLRYISHHAKFAAEAARLGRPHPNPRGEPDQVAPRVVKGAHHLEGVRHLPRSFTDANIYYQKYKDFDSVNFYRESLFQVMPRSNFDMHDQLADPNLTYDLVHADRRPERH